MTEPQNEEKLDPNYPKMLTAKLKDGRVVPLMKDNQPVVFANRDEERAFDKSTATVHDGRPEQFDQPAFTWFYDPFRRV
jgi:hypothetical protein